MTAPAPVPQPPRLRAAEAARFLTPTKLHFDGAGEGSGRGTCEALLWVSRSHDAADEWWQRYMGGDSSSCTAPDTAVGIGRQ
eukprot:39699-Chlamydomonas_euryale.AAC.4